jgi:16S rRNA (adenine1518-N6/adenine1519-N6)-dimethyltransferase
MGKKLGQHFLISEKKLRQAAENLDLKSKDAVIEIGPGHGELTRELRKINSESKLTLIEKDNELAEGLKEKFKDDKNIQIMEGDALKAIPSVIGNPSFIIHDYKITGNIPYYITGHLFRVIGDLENKPSVCVFTVQKEVAERVTAEPPRMNLLAASVGLWAKPKIISHVPKKYFRPAPKVDSAIIKLAIHGKQLAVKKQETYYSLIKIIFKQPRKTVLNNLLSGFKNIKKEEIAEKLEKAGINPKDRPQNIKIKQLIELSTLF